MAGPFASHHQWVSAHSLRCRPICISPTPEVSSPFYLPGQGSFSTVYLVLSTAIKHYTLYLSSGLNFAVRKIGKCQNILVVDLGLRFSLDK